MCIMGQLLREVCLFKAVVLDYLLTPSTVKTGRWAGVVTAFITMSNIKDEIDWECRYLHLLSPRIVISRISRAWG